MFNKFKNFISNLFLKIKALFLKIKPYIKKYGIIILVSVLFLISFCNVDCKTAKASELTPTSNIIDRVSTEGNTYFYYNLGEISQTVITMGSGNINNRLNTSVSLPTYLYITFFDDNEYRISVGFGSYGSAFDSDSYLDIENYSYNNEFVEFNHTFDSYNTNISSSQSIITFNDNYSIADTAFTHNSYISELGFTTDKLGKYVNNYSFGFPYCQKAVYHTDLTQNGGNIFTNYDSITQDGTTYFYLGGKVNSMPTRLLAYNKSYKSVSMGLDSSKFWINSSMFEIHTFIFNNDTVIRYGYNVPSRYYPAPVTKYYDATYYLESTGGSGDGDLCFTQEELDHLLERSYREGWVDGSNESVENVVPTTFIKAMVSNFLAIQLFGDVTLGIVFSIAFGVLLFGLIIKLFLGG